MNNKTFITIHSTKINTIYAFGSYTIFVKTCNFALLGEPDRLFTDNRNAQYYATEGNGTLEEIIGSLKSTPDKLIKRYL